MLVAYERARLLQFRAGAKRLREAGEKVTKCKSKCARRSPSGDVSIELKDDTGGKGTFAMRDDVRVPLASKKHPEATFISTGGINYPFTVHRRVLKGANVEYTIDFASEFVEVQGDTVKLSDPCWQVVDALDASAIVLTLERGEFDRLVLVHGADGANGTDLTEQIDWWDGLVLQDRNSEKFYKFGRNAFVDGVLMAQTACDFYAPCETHRRLIQADELSNFRLQGGKDQKVPLIKAPLTPEVDSMCGMNIDDEDLWGEFAESGTHAMVLVSQDERLEFKPLTEIGNLQYYFREIEESQSQKKYGILSEEANIKFTDTGLQISNPTREQRHAYFASYRDKKKKTLYGSAKKDGFRYKGKVYVPINPIRGFVLVHERAEDVPALTSYNYTSVKYHDGGEALNLSQFVYLELICAEPGHGKILMNEVKAFAKDSGKRVLLSSIETPVLAYKKAFGFDFVEGLATGGQTSPSILVQGQAPILAPPSPPP